MDPVTQSSGFTGLDQLPFADELRPAPAQLRRGGEYELAHFDAAILGNVQAANAVFRECALTDCTLQDATLRRSRLQDIWIGGTRVLACDLAETTWTDVTFDAAMLAGLQAFGTTWHRAVFRRCKFTSVNLREAVLDDVRFDGCVMNDVDFAGARLTKVAFEGSRLAEVDFTKAKLTAVDLRGARIDSLTGYEHLAGATIDSVQLVEFAPMLAAALGITIDDEPAAR